LAQFRWRPMTEADLGSVAQIAAIAFPHHYEDPACFAERLALSPAWCFGLEDEEGALKGYVVAYPWPLGAIPPLNARLGALPDGSDALFLHDLALHPDIAGTGQAGAIVEQIAAEAQAAGFDDIALVAVNDTAGFWEREASPLQADRRACGRSSRPTMRACATCDGTSPACLSRKQERRRRHRQRNLPFPGQRRIISSWTNPLRYRVTNKGPAVAPAYFVISRKPRGSPSRSAIS
jgi:ribosomal protein S18 acetylase RimI-like enzyme